MTTTPKRNGKPQLFGMAVLLVLIVGSTLYYVDTFYQRKPVEMNPSPERLAATANQGIHCTDGKAWNTTINGSGFQMSEAVVIDGQFVDCAMTYTVKGQALTLEELSKQIRSDS